MGVRTTWTVADPGPGAAPSRPILFTTDGGARQDDADLWCTYAAIRTAYWLGRRLPDKVAQASANYLLSRRNTDGGFAWARGLRSDVWATYYCTQALRDLGMSTPEHLALRTWLEGLRNPDGGFGMTFGQPSDVWATYYAARTYREILGGSLPQPSETIDWLSGLGTPDGGLSWQPGYGEPDVRAVYYAVSAAHAIGGGPRPSWDRGRLVGWLRARQAGEGGFAFGDGDTPCLWATFRAVRALDRLAAQPARPEDAVRWILSRRLPSGGFARWADYDDADVWAGFSAVGALITLGHELAPAHADELTDFLIAGSLPEGGFTYRRRERAGDALATAAALLLSPRRAEASDALARWLHHAHLPYEEGLMYMPGRGAEVRCTLWAVSALQHTGQPGLDTDRLVSWFDRIRNPDGGYGYWHGRGSDLVATSSVVETLLLLGRAVPPAAASSTIGFLERCRVREGFAFVPDGDATAANTAQGVRLHHVLGRPLPAEQPADLLAGYRSPLGGYANRPGQLPDLLSTYQVIRSQQVVGLSIDHQSLRRFLARVRRPEHQWAWSPLGTTGGILADCLGEQLVQALDRGQPLLPLNL